MTARSLTQLVGGTLNFARLDVRMSGAEAEACKQTVTHVDIYTIEWLKLRRRMSIDEKFIIGVRNYAENKWADVIYYIRYI